MRQKIELAIPEQLRMLCELLDTTPQEVLQAFINDLSQEVASSGSDERAQAAGYFMRCGYGMHRYDVAQVEEMLDGLNWLRWQQYEKSGAAYKALQRAFLKEWFAGWKERGASGG